MIINILKFLYKIIFTFHMALILFIILVVLLVPKMKFQFSFSSNHDFIKQNCYSCHDLKRIFYFQKTKEQWHNTVKRMRDKTAAEIPEEKLKKITELLADNYGVDREKLFKQLCIKCHSQINKKELLYVKQTKEDWKNAIERMRWRFNFLIGADQAKEIYKYWTDLKNNANLELDDKNQDQNKIVFEKKCLRCHTYRFIKNPPRLKQEWEGIFSRMRLKYSSWITQEDNQSIKSYIYNKKNKFLIQN
ncbi:MAG: hypothetical protein ABIG64_08980 [Candidatus Omnitrophota bacterium]